MTDYCNEEIVKYLTKSMFSKLDDGIFESIFTTSNSNDKENETLTLESFKK